MDIKDEMVSEYTIKMFGVMKKMVTTLRMKVKYVIHNRNVKVYQRLGLR